MFDGGGNGQCAGTHDDDNVGGIRGANVIKQMILTTGEAREFVHCLLNNRRDRIVILVDGFTADKIHVRVLSGTADGRAIWSQGTLTVSNDQILVDDGAHIIVGQFFDLHNLVGGTETVKEMDKRNAGRQGGLGRDQSKVLGFLYILGA